MLTVAAYMKGIPPGNKNPEKPAIIKNFIEGVNYAGYGDKGVIVDSYVPLDTDVGVIQGFVHPGSKSMPHLTLRKNVLERQRVNNKRTIIVDSNLFLYADKDNSKGYLRYSYDGVFPNTGEYCNKNPNPRRWDTVSKHLGIELQPWRKRQGQYHLICCQRDGGWSMSGMKVVPWVVRILKEVSERSDRLVVIRFHPGDKKAKDHVKQIKRLGLRNIRFSTNENILTDFERAFSVINFNSSPAVASAIQGIPTFVLDPARSQAAAVSHHNLELIENPKEFDRELWIQQIAQMHWTLDELKTGEAWAHLRNWAKK